MTEIFIHDAVRTPRAAAKPKGGLAGETPQGLVAALVAALEERTGFSRVDATNLTLGCVGQVGAQGGHLAMVTKMAADFPDETIVHTLNNFCASGLSAVGQVAAALAWNGAGAALAGGVEMMSRVPFMADKADYYTDTSLAPLRSYIPVALAAELLAEDEGITREAMDEAAFVSHERALAAEERPAYNASRIAVGDFAREENPRAISRERLAKLPPAFSGLAAGYEHALGGRTISHALTVAHAPPMSDGAGLALVGPAVIGDGKPRAKILAYAEAGDDPRRSLLAGFSAMDRALDRAGLDLASVGRIEFMEAFAPTIVMLERDRDVDMAKVNVTGGHLAKGHPMGASGAILLSTLLDVLEADDAETGLVVLAGAQGVGAAMVVERVN